MAKKQPILEQMRRNPKDDWRIDEVLKVCDQHELEYRLPKGTSHYVVSSPLLRDSLCVPYKRPIKPIYIKNLVSYVDAHILAKKEGEID